MEQEIFISKFDIKGESIYTKITWKANGNDLFLMNVLVKDASWSGNYSNDTANKFRELTDEDETQYEKNVKECLKNCDSQYIIDFVANANNTALFCWKKKFEGSTAVLIHGKVTLLLDQQPERKDQLIDILLKENSKLQQIISKCKQDSEKLNFDLEKSKKELATFADQKISMETTLYGKFIQLLNAKKRRIQLLEDILKNNEKN
ncbi:uncharacterized protein LOC119828617 [Zerene cesonia]|uniref:uncharacterized protein LOC119828617 n=1 Tax=Zerene cesonia TaxID=33412 RepID=UPI0018E5516E|nr:uncharacterized protein LOC119828617 [Zerene cesonia]